MSSSTQSHLLEACLPSAMRDIGKAIQCDSNGEHKRAYVLYLSCVQNLTQYLLLDAKSEDFGITSSTKKCIQLGQNCLDRLGDLVEDLEKAKEKSNDEKHLSGNEMPWQPPPTEGWPEPPDSPVDSLETSNGEISMQNNRPISTYSSGQESFLSTPETEEPASIPLTPLTPSSPYLPEFKAIGESETDTAIKRPRRLTPLEQAKRQNQMLLIAYKARMSSMSTSRTNSASFRLSLQRKLVENIAIGKAREEALAKKMEERHQRLQEEAARRFTSTMGMSKDEQERRKMYTSILDYEHKTQWLLPWREKIKSHPDDIILMQALAEAILKDSEHPITTLISQIQHKLHNKLEPLLLKYIGKLKNVMVPYTEANADQKKSNEDSKCSDEEVDGNCGQKQKEQEFCGDATQGETSYDVVSEEIEVQELNKKGLQRHLKQLIKDIKMAMEKIQSMFIIAYEELDSPAGRDACYSVLEMPFFQPLWPFLLPLFRLVNQDSECSLALTMTKLRPVTPSIFKIPEEMCPSPDYTAHRTPFAPAIESVEQLLSIHSPLAKLEQIVKMCRDICDCVIEYNPKKDASAVVGADDLLPIMCYVIAHCAMPQIISECHAMEEFIHEGYLMGEEGYCLTTLNTAIAFLQKL